MSTRTSAEEASPVRWLFVSQAGLMTVALAGLLLTGLFSPTLFYVLSFIGLLVVSQVFAPKGSTPRWWARLRFVLVASFVIFVFVTGQSVLDLLG